jgi:3-phosphoshikimate 1-carboxyvinyltransferase
MTRPVPAGRVVRGTVTPPPSKSVTHRCLSLALLGGKECRIERPLLAEDTRLYLDALGTLGWSVEHRGEDVMVTPPARPERSVERREVFCGNAGTMFRFLTAILTVLPGRFRLDGTPRLRERPVGPLLEALRSLGARIECPVRAGHAPLEIEGESLRGGRALLDAGESSQYLSALLLACLRAPGASRLEVAALTSSPYVELTREAIRRAVSGGDPVRERPPAEKGAGSRAFEISPVTPSARRLPVEADLSAACYPAAGAALTGGTVVIEGVRSDSAQGDRRFFGLLERMGAAVSWSEDGAEVRGTGRLDAPGGVDLSATPDQVPTLAALAPFARGVTRIENVAHLRIKESDRLRSMADGLARLGVPVEERPDGLVIPGCWAEERRVVPGERTVIDPHDDHRIAMSFALVGLRRDGVVVARPEVVAKSYPGFWDDLDALLR